MYDLTDVAHLYYCDIHLVLFRLRSQFLRRVVSYRCLSELLVDRRLERKKATLLRIMNRTLQ